MCKNAVRTPLPQTVRVFCIMECPICCVSAKETVQCPECQQSTCVTCVVKFIEVEAGNLQCMMCKALWSTHFAYMAIPSARWTKHMKTQRKAFLEQQSRAELIDVQAAVPTLRRIEDNMEKIRAKRVELKRLREELTQLEEQKTHDLFEVNRVLYAHGQPGESLSQSAHRRELPHPCPRENCRGFLQDNGCPVCSVKVCSRCKCEKTTEDHVCDPVILQNLLEIQKSTRPCPKCRAPSQKINGCSQVFCYACKNSWMWDTGRLVRPDEWQHSPDYYDYIRQTRGSVPRAPGDGGGGLDDNPETHRFHLVTMLRDSTYIIGPKTSSENNHMARGRSYNGQLSDVGQFLMQVDQSIGEYQDRQHNFLRGQHRPIQPGELLKDARIRFLMGKMNEVQWKKELARREKQAVLVRQETQLHDELRRAFQTCARTVSLARNPYREDVMHQGVVDFARACQVIDKEYNSMYNTMGSSKSSPIGPIVANIPSEYR